MSGLHDLYAEDFFAEWGRGNRAYVDSAFRIADAIHAQFRPRSVADLGCGCGVYAHRFRQLGARALPLDGVRPPEAHAFETDVALADLAEPFENRWGKFDLAICFEVGEHIAPEKADVFLRNVIQFSDRVLLSCAPPNQGGHHHVNEQPKRYWVRKMAELGFLYMRTATGQLMERMKADPPAYCWMFNQISVYEKAGAFSPVEKCLPFRLRYEG